MRIDKNTYDKSYPYTIRGGWGGSVCASRENLEELRDLIENILKEVEDND